MASTLNNLTERLSTSVESFITDIQANHVLYDSDALKLYDEMIATNQRLFFTALENIRAHCMESDIDLNVYDGNSFMMLVIGAVACLNYRIKNNIPDDWIHSEFNARIIMIRHLAHIVDLSFVQKGFKFVLQNSHRDAHPIYQKISKHLVAVLLHTGAEITTSLRGLDVPKWMARYLIQLVRTGRYDDNGYHYWWGNDVDTVDSVVDALLAD